MYFFNTAMHLTIRHQISLDCGLQELSLSKAVGAQIQGSGCFIQVIALPLSSFVTLGKLFCASVSQM